MELGSLPIITITYCKYSKQCWKFQKLNPKSLNIILTIISSLQLLLSGVILGKLISFSQYFSQVTCVSSNISNYKNSFTTVIIIFAIQFSITVVMYITVFNLTESYQIKQIAIEEVQNQRLNVLTTPISKFQQKNTIDQEQIYKEFNQRKIIEAIKFVTDLERSHYCFPTNNYKSHSKKEKNRLDYNLVERLQKNRINGGFNDSSSLGSQAYSKKSIESEDAHFEINKQKILQEICMERNIDIRKWDQNPLYETLVVRQFKPNLDHIFVDGI